MIKKQLLISVKFLLVATVVLGIAYPLAMTGISQLVFPYQANGSLIEQDGKIVGSELIGQNFTTENYFWGRPSSTADHPYNGASSGGSNKTTIGATAEEVIQARIDLIRKTMPESATQIPVDLVTASGSGLDPHISKAAALFQVERVANARHVDVSRVKALVTTMTEGRTWLVFGEERVNVLKLNLALNQLK